MPDIPAQRHCFYGALTTTEINALTGMHEGDHAYDTTLKELKTYNGSSWDSVGGGAGNTLGQAYNQGGSGVGRTITTASSLPVQLLGPAGMETAGDILPTQDNVQNLGSSGKRWNNCYTGDIILKNDWVVSELEDEAGNLMDPGGVVIKNKKGEPILTITDDGLYFKGRKIA
jgi:hypothetical protein